MKIIDAHIHTHFHKPHAQEVARQSQIDFSMKGLKKEMADNGVAWALTLTEDLGKPTPMGKEWIAQQLVENPRLVAIAGVDPTKMTAAGLSETRRMLQNGPFSGIKIYSGYIWKYPTDHAYEKVYALAEDFGCPVIFHTGDTLSTIRSALVKYAHPLHIDEVAVRHPRMKIVLAHAGYPWVRDAAEVAYKNQNVSVDISGWVFGRRHNPHDAHDVQWLIDYCGANKVLYGSDWPVTTMKTCIDFFKKAIPHKHWNSIFYNNASVLFGLR